MVTTPPGKLELESPSNHARLEGEDWLAVVCMLFTRIVHQPLCFFQSDLQSQICISDTKTDTDNLQLGNRR